MKILVVGDYISDVYTFGTATRLCPEAPVPVLTEISEKTSAGGAGLVGAQLKSFGLPVNEIWLSYSEKKRLFANGHLVCRVDRDSINDSFDGIFGKAQLDYDAFVVADYGKCAHTYLLARQIVETGKPCFVDAKPHWNWYYGKNVTIFPNHLEAQPIRLDKFSTIRAVGSDAYCSYDFGCIVNKMGKDGCRLNDADHKDFAIPAAVTEVVDVTGAGDIFMAGYVYAWTLQLPAEHCLRFANELAGESCRHLGTYVVPREFAQGVLDKLRASTQSAAQDQQSFRDSIVRANLNIYPGSLWPNIDIPQKDSSQDRATFEAAERILENVQTRLQSPLVPTESSDTQPLENPQIPEDRNSWQLAENIQNSIDSAHQCEHKPAQDRVLHPGKS